MIGVVLVVIVARAVRDPDPIRLLPLLCPLARDHHDPTARSSTLSGEDCPTDGQIVGNLIRRGDRWFEAGRFGDHVSLGDWDVTVDTRRWSSSTGEVFVFDHWATTRADHGGTGGGGAHGDVAGDGHDGLWPPRPPCRWERRESAQRRATR
jgi:hypothetical protein